MNNVSDSQVLEDLLAQIPLDEQIDSVYTDGAYDTKHCRKIILEGITVGGNPMATLKSIYVRQLSYKD